MRILDRLESAYGVQEPCWPADPYLFLLWWHSGYPPSDAACAKGWESLNRKIGTAPESILREPNEDLANVLAAGGMVPELRAARLKQIATRVLSEFGGDLRSGLAGSLAAVRKTLKSFPNIADPGADRILLFAGIAPVAAVPSNCPHVLVRIRQGCEGGNYGRTYTEAQQAIAAEVPETIDARARAYLLLKRHGQEVCKRAKPKCEECVVRASCAFCAGKTRGRATVSRRS